MYFFLILFFISLFGIVLMIGKKIVFADVNGSEETEKFIQENFDIDNIKHIAVKNTKKYGFQAFIMILRFYIKFSYFLKNKYKKSKIIVKYLVNNYLVHKDKDVKEKEVSSFLKKVSEYKYRIREIKDKIKEEEGIK